MKHQIEDAKSLLRDDRHHMADMQTRHAEAVIAEQKIQAELRARLRQKENELELERAKRVEQMRLATKEREEQEEHYSELISESIEEIGKLKAQLKETEADRKALAVPSGAGFDMLPASEDPWEGQRLSSMMALSERDFQDRLEEKDARIADLEASLLEMETLNPMQGVEALRREAAQHP